MKISKDRYANYQVSGIHLPSEEKIIVGVTLQMADSPIEEKKETDNRNEIHFQGAIQAANTEELQEKLMEVVQNIQEINQP